MNGAPKQVEKVALGSVTPFGTGDLGGVAGEEVIHGLFRRQLGDRRQNPEGVRRQHDDRARLRRRARSCWAFGMKCSG